jgi:hypothetical protein
VKLTQKTIPGEFKVEPITLPISIEQCLGSVLARWAYCDSALCDRRQAEDAHEITVRLRLSGQREGFLYLGMSRALVLQISANMTGSSELGIEYDVACEFANLVCSAWLQEVRLATGWWQLRSEPPSIVSSATWPKVSPYVEGSVLASGAIVTCKVWLRDPLTDIRG